MSEMGLSETFERFNESMKRAVSRAKELGHAQKNNSWFQVATHLEKLRQNGDHMYRHQVLTRSQTLAMLDARTEKAIAAETKH